MTVSSLRITFPAQEPLASRLRGALTGVIEAIGLRDVEILPVPADSYRQQLEWGAMSGTLPDVFQLGPSHLMRYVNAERIASIARIAEGLPPGALVTAGQDAFGLALGLTAPVVAVDADVLREFHLDPPGPGWSGREFERLMVTLSQGTRKVAIADGLYRLPHFDRRWFVPPAGEGGEFEIQTEALTDWLARCHRLRESGVVPPNGIRLQGGAGPDPRFLTGETPAEILYAHEIAAAELVHRDLAVAPIPAWYSNQVPVRPRPEAVLCAARNSGRLEEALVLLSRLAVDQAAARRIGVAAGIAASPELRASVRPYLDGAEGLAFDFIVSQATDTAPYPADPIALSEMLVGPLTVAALELLAGNAGLAEAIHSVAEGAEAVKAASHDRDETVFIPTMPLLTGLPVERVIEVPLEVKTYAAP